MTGKNQWTIYSIYLRNHGECNTFNSLVRDLDRIRDLGFDALWLLPVHPIGQVNKKGPLGCPYAIADYGAINPEYGTKDDFAAFIRRAHEKGLKVIMDVVYNHTAHDADLYRRDPRFYLRDAAGNPVTKEPEWADVIDLDFSNRDLWPLLMGYLKSWVTLGVDGFRCDVASLVPMDFWRAAKAAVAEVKAGVLWLGESVHTEFLHALRQRGYEGADDATLFEVFDILYDYDIHPVFEDFVKGRASLRTYIDAVEDQDRLYPEGYVKLRFIENHDQPRFLAYGRTQKEKEKFTVMVYLLKGATLFYGGQETDTVKTPSLFEVDPVDFSREVPEYVALVKKLNGLMKEKALAGDERVYEVVGENLLIIRDPESLFVAAVNFGSGPLTHDFALGGSYRELTRGEAPGPLDRRTIEDYLIFTRA